MVINYDVLQNISKYIYTCSLLPVRIHVAHGYFGKGYSINISYFQLDVGGVAVVMVKSVYNGIGKCSND